MICALCRAVNEDATEGGRPYDRHLLVTNRFIVIPALGPIAPGHIMIVSRDHSPNLASMGPQGIQEFKAVVDHISNRPGYDEMLQAEHGASSNESGGACITHVHINVIPGLSHLASIFKGILPPLELDYDLLTFDSVSPPYILLRGSKDAYLHRANNVPSQLIRRVLFERMGRDDWDWAVHPNLKVITETIELWRVNG